MIHELGNGEAMPIELGFGKFYTEPYTIDSLIVNLQHFRDLLDNQRLYSFVQTAVASFKRKGVDVIIENLSSGKENFKTSIDFLITEIQRLPRILNSNLPEIR